MAHRVTFERCFPERKLRPLIATLPKTFSVLNSMAEWQVDWPTHVRCMSDSEILRMRRHGAGHGYTYTRGRGTDSIWMNHYMTIPGYWLVFVHENLHHAFPDATEDELNCAQLPYVYKQVFGKTLDPAYARKHGVGSPVPGVGDRSFCR